MIPEATKIRTRKKDIRDTLAILRLQELQMIKIKELMVKYITLAIVDNDDKNSNLE